MGKRQKVSFGTVKATTELDAKQIRVGGDPYNEEPGGQTGRIVDGGDVTPSTAIAASAGLVKESVERFGDIIKTTLVLDLTGLKSVATLGDIIGDTGVSYIGQVTAAINGTIFRGEVNCGEVPLTGDDDIDLYAATEATGAYDGAIGDLTETALMAAGAALAIGTAHPLTALPVADAYLYLTAGAGDTAGTYTAGVISIELWGYAS